MSGDGTPDEPTKRLGEAIAQLRAQRGWTRTVLANRAIYSLPPDHDLVNTIGEGWINRLESGRIVKVPSDALDVIFNTLGCDLYQRTAILMRANRNPLADAEGVTTPEGELLGQVMVRLYEDEELRASLQELCSNGRKPDAIADEIAEKIKHMIEVKMI